jgi:hypothetical protein
VISSRKICRSARFRLVALLVAATALAGLVGGCGGGDESPESILSNASLEGVESGSVELALQVESKGKKGGHVDVTLSGPFERGDELPQFALKGAVNGSVSGEILDFEGGLTLLPDRAFLNYEGTEYEINQEYFDLAQPTFLPLKPGQGKKGTVSALNACLEAAAGLDLASFGSNLKDEGSVDIDGTATTKISGDLNVPAALDALVELAENPSCKAQLTAAGRSAEDLKKLEGELAASTGKAHIDVYVDDEHIIRKVAGELAAEPKASGPVEAEFELTVSDVNEVPKIPVPTGGKSILLWLGRFGIEPFNALFLAGETEGLAQLLELVAADVLPAPQG